MPPETPQLPETPASQADTERHLALALEAGRMVAWTWDPAVDRVEVFGNLLGIYGVSAVGHAEQGFGMIHSDDLARHRAVLNAALAAGQPYSSEFRIARPDNGETVWLEERAVPTLAADGRLTRLTGVTIDVTSRKQVEAALRDTETLLEQGFASLDYPLLLLAMPERTIVSANPAFERVFGYRLDEIAGRSTAALHVDEPHFEEFGRRLFALLDADGAAHLEYEMRRKNGELFLAEVTSNEIRSADGRRRATVSVVRDITARRQAEVALREARFAAESAADRMTRLQRLTSALASSISPGEVFEVAVREGAAALEAAAGGLSLVSADRRWLEVAHEWGYATAEAAPLVRLPLDTPAAGPEVVRTGQPLWIESTDDWVRRFPQAAGGLNPQFQASAILPLAVGGQTLGILAFSFPEARRFAPTEREFLLALAGQCAQALERARLFAETQSLNAELESRVRARSAELLASELRFHLMVDSVQDYAIFMLEPDGAVASWNNGARRIKGYAAEDIIGRHFSLFYTPEDLAIDKPRRALARAAEAGRYEDESWRVRRDGSRFWANVIITPVRRDDGTLLGYVKVTRDLTERRKSEEQARQTARRLAEAEHIAHLGSWHWDIAAGAVSWSDELYRLHGLAPHASGLSLETFLSHVHPDDRERVRTALARAVETRWPFALDHRIIRADGLVRTLYLAGEAVEDAAGQVVALSGASQDITERKLIEDELHRSREQLRQLSARLEGAREDERARIAREIHDELGGMLTGLKMDVARLRRAPEGAGPQAQERLDILSAAIDESVKTVRRIASDLRPAVLDDFGLLAAMEWQLTEFARRSGLTFTWICDAEDPPLPREATTAVFRVFQESLTNIARHAEARHVEVTASVRDGRLALRVADDGRGITPEQSRGAQSLGLVGMRERIGVLGGSVEIQGSPGSGTVVLVSVPLPE